MAFGLYRQCLVGFSVFIVLLTFMPHSQADDFFELRIRPVLIEQCFQCHSEAANELKSKLHLDSREGVLLGGASGTPALIPGKPEASLLINAIKHADADLTMPPKFKLADSVIADFEQWIATGAVYPASTQPIDLMAKAKQHWAFHPPKVHALPVVKNTAWPRTEIDHFVLAKLEENNLSPAKEADRRTLIRRLSFDLVGLPPTADEVDTFVNSTDPDAYVQLVDRFLASPHYGERWGRHWLDVARYADTKGYVYGRDQINFIHSYVYRDWVVEALNKDMPYDQFIKLQLAADTMSDKTSRDDLAAMGFLTLGQRFLGVIPDIIDDRIDTVTRGLMGLTVSCARCHDHKFDPIPIEDYYSLYGVFSASSEQRTLLRPAALEEESYAAFTEGLREREAKLQSIFETKSIELELRLRAQVDRYLVAVPTVGTLPTDDFYEIRNAEDINPTIVRRWDDYIQKLNISDPIFGLWKQLAELPTESFVEKSVELLATSNANGIILAALRAAKPAQFSDAVAAYATTFKSVNDEWLALVGDAEKAKQALPTQLLDTDREALRAVLFSEESPIRVPEGSLKNLVWMFDETARVELSQQNANIETWIIQAQAAPKYSMILADNPEAKLARVFHRGNPATPGAEVPRQFLELFSGDDRKPFASGSGRAELAEAIASADNPLTARVMVNRVWGWHFGAGLNATPSDFGTRSAPPSHPELLDWLANYFVQQGWSLKQLHRQLLLSSTYRQSSTPDLPEQQLATFTNTDPENRLLWHFNVSRLDFESLRDALLFVSGDIDLAVGGQALDLMTFPSLTRRTLYGKVDRRFLPTIFRVFDFPNPDMHSPQRGNTTVPQQALFFMNNGFAQSQSRAFARRATEAAPTTEQRISWMYQAAYQREATPDQLKQALQFIEQAEASTPPTPPEPEPVFWTYGYGKYDDATEQMASFTPIPYFTGDAYQGDASWPNDVLGWAQLTADGGHPGNTQDHAVIRRWTAPVSGKINIQGRIKHEPIPGDGVRARIISNTRGTIGQWLVHASEADTHIYSIEVNERDTIDFVVDIYKGLNSDQFIWTPEVHWVSDPPTVWNAVAEFAGPFESLPVPLTAWEKFAQVLLSSNEFLYVD